MNPLFYGLPYRLRMGDGDDCWLTVTVENGGTWTAGYQDDHGRMLKDYICRSDRFEVAVKKLKQKFIDLEIVSEILSRPTTGRE